MQGFTQMLRQYNVAAATAAYRTRLKAMVFPAARWQPVPMRLGGIAYPFWLRPGTSDWRVMHQIFVAQEYSPGSDPHEAAVRQFYQDTLDNGETPVIMDCGANIGLAAVWYATCFPDATIIAIEPEPDNFRILEMNAARYANIIPVHAGISDHRTRASLVNDCPDPWAWETREGNGPGAIEMVTIPDQMARIPHGRPLIVKIDIEGAELDLFRSGLDWVSRIPVIVFESHDRRFAWRGTFHAIASALIDQPRDYIQQGENTFAFSHELLRPALAAG